MEGGTRTPGKTSTINQVHAFPDPTSHLMIVGNLYYTTAPMYGFVFTNNMVATGQYPVWNTGGGTANCGYFDVPIISINKCFTTVTFSNNALVATPSAFPPSKCPVNNLFQPTINDSGFGNSNTGNGGSY